MEMHCQNDLTSETFLLYFGGWLSLLSWASDQINPSSNVSCSVEPRIIFREDGFRSEHARFAP